MIYEEIDKLLYFILNNKKIKMKENFLQESLNVIILGQDNENNRNRKANIDWADNLVSLWLFYILNIYFFS